MICLLTTDCMANEVTSKFQHTCVYIHVYSVLVTVIVHGWMSSYRENAVESVSPRQLRTVLRLQLVWRGFVPVPWPVDRLATFPSQHHLLIACYQLPCHRSHSVMSLLSDRAASYQKPISM